MITRYRLWADRLMDGQDARASRPPQPERAQLTASQHILHLLLTVFTGGLWAPVWLVRAMNGNAPARESGAL